MRQVHWDLVIVDEAHRMSAADESHKSLRYKLGELLRDTSDHLLLLTATPHKGDPENFSLFLQLLDADCLRGRQVDPRSDGPQRAPFYLRRTKEAMVYFPRAASRTAPGPPRRSSRSASRTPWTSSIDGAEFDLYREVTRFVKRRERPSRGRRATIRGHARSAS